MKRPLILLHGALGASSQFAKLIDLLIADFDVYTLDFNGHGGKPIPEERFSIQLFSEDLKGMIATSGLKSPFVFGYSMGGYVALYLEANRPGLLGPVFTLGTKFAWNTESSVKEANMLNPANIQDKLPQFAAALDQRHKPSDWKAINNKTAEMILSLGKEPALKESDLSKIQIKVCISLGDSDKMVTQGESENVASILPNGSFKLLADTLHPIEKIDADMLARELRSFFTYSL